MIARPLCHDSSGAPPRRGIDAARYARIRLPVCSKKTSGSAPRAAAVACLAIGHLRGAAGAEGDVDVVINWRQVLLELGERVSSLAQLQLQICSGGRSIAFGDGGGDACDLGLDVP